MYFIPQKKKHYLYIFDKLSAAPIKKVVYVAQDA